MKLVILSRAPLDYHAGIPKFCKTLSNSLHIRHVVINYSLSDPANFITTHGSKFKSQKLSLLADEHTYNSQFVYKTFAFSFDYFFALIKLPFSERTLFHYQHPDPFSAFCVLFAKFLNFRRVSIVTTWHADIYQNYLLFSPVLLFLDLLLFLFSDRIVFPTKSHYNSSLLSFLSVFNEKISFIPFGLFTKESINLLPKFSLSNTQPPNFRLFLSIGRLVPYKGYESVIKAFALLSQRCTSFRYDIIGRGPLFDLLTSQIAFYNLSSHVFIHTNISEAEKSIFLSKSDCFILPSISQAEAFGLVQLEAFAYGLPIINTYLANGVNEVAPPEIALTLPPNSPRLMAAQLSSICSNSTVLYELSKFSKHRSYFFSLDSMSQLYSSLYLSLTV